jgi:hypothetical protein
VAVRKITVPEISAADSEPEHFSQRKRPEAGRFWLQVDRQTKGSYQTAEAAQTIGLAIKKDYPIVQVSIYDAVDCLNTMVELAPSS